MMVTGMMGKPKVTPTKSEGSALLITETPKQNSTSPTATATGKPFAEDAVTLTATPSMSTVVSAPHLDVAATPLPRVTTPISATSQPPASPETVRLVRDGEVLMEVVLVPARLSYDRHEGKLQSKVEIPKREAAVLPGSSAFGTGWVGIAGHVSLTTGPGPFAPLIRARDGDVIVGCNDDDRCWSYRVSVERTEEDMLDRQLEERASDLVVHTCTPDLRGYIVLTGELTGEINDG
jgi:hypothetical protein